MTLTLGALHRFPVKSLRGEALTSGIVEAHGLAGDRRWMLVDETGECVTAREYPTLLLVTPTRRPDGGLVVQAADLPALSVEVPDSPVHVPVTVFGRTPFLASLAADDAHAWFGTLLDVPVRLVYSDDPSRRHANPDFAGPDAPMAFQDGYPLNVATTASLDALNAAIADGPRADEGPIPMIRFRPNLVVDGPTAPWAEDGWRRVRVGEAFFRAVKGCDRCAIPTTDHLTARRFKEPTYSLAQQRRFDGAVWFGMNLVPENPGMPIRPGDEVEVLESVPAPDGPPR